MPCYIPYTFVDSINVFDCHLFDVFIEYTELVAKTIRNIFVYIADQKQPNTSRARMDSGKLTLFLLLQALKRGVASQDFAEKQSVPTFMFRHK